MNTLLPFWIVFTSFVAMANDAVHISDFGCGMLNGKGGSVYTTDSRVTATPTSRGITVMKCTANNVAKTTGRDVYWNYENTGYRCNTRMGTTNDWTEKVRTDGVAVLTCTIRK
jgi:hypothetical protein